MLELTAMGIFMFIILLFSYFAIEVRSILYSILFLSVASLIAVVLFLMWQAPDVAMTEAVIGAGFTTFLLLMAYHKLFKHNKEEGDE